MIGKIKTGGCALTLGELLTMGLLDVTAIGTGDPIDQRIRAAQRSILAAIGLLERCADAFEGGADDPAALAARALMSAYAAHDSLRSAVGGPPAQRDEP